MTIEEFNAKYGFHGATLLVRSYLMNVRDTTLKEGKRIEMENEIRQVMFDLESALIQLPVNLAYLSEKG